MVSGRGGCVGVERGEVRWSGVVSGGVARGEVGCGRMG